MPVSAERRERIAVEAGDEVDVELDLDTAPRVVEVPEDLAKALGADSDARRTFDSLTASQQRGFVAPIDAQVRRLDNADHPGVEQHAGHRRGCRLRDREDEAGPRKDIVQYGFGAVSRLLVEHGLRDERRLWGHPLIAGKGSPSDLLFGAVPALGSGSPTRPRSATGSSTSAMRPTRP